MLYLDLSFHRDQFANHRLACHGNLNNTGSQETQKDTDQCTLYRVVYRHQYRSSR